MTYLQQQQLADSNMTSRIQHEANEHSCHNNSDYCPLTLKLKLPSPDATKSSNTSNKSSEKMLNATTEKATNELLYQCQNGQQTQHTQQIIGETHYNYDSIPSSQNHCRCQYNATTKDLKTIRRHSNSNHRTNTNKGSSSSSSSTTATPLTSALQTKISSPLSSSESSSISFTPSRWLGLDIGMWLRLVLTYTVMAASLLTVHAKPTSDADRMYKELQSKTVKYLAQFGYLKGPSTETQNLRSGEELERAIKALQKAGGIPQTGVPDSRTDLLLTKPRCGNKDEYINDGRYSHYRYKSTDRQAPGYNPNGDDYSGDTRTYRYRRRRSLNRQKRYTTANSSWKNANLTFRFINYTPDLPQGKTRQIISDALRVWSDATPLSFSEVRQSQADIMIQFASNYHSDGYPFDGKGMVLAHAFFPGLGKGGDTHFDDDENWATDHTDGVDLFVVAAHEFGHALGLAHSGDPEALMYPWYMGFEGKFKLPQDDFLGITSLYGSKEKIRDIPKTPSPKDGVVMIPKPDVPSRNPRPDYDVSTPKVIDESGPPDPCKSHIDALTVFRTELFLFIGKWFWRLDSRKLITKPVEIHSFWYGLPKHLERIDAVYERPDSKLVFFSGDRYWIFNANHLKSGFPSEGRPITEFNIPADVKKIDAAFVWGYNKRTYLVSGDMYWKMNKDNRFVEYDYPRDMGTWKGVPVPLDAAFRDWNGKTYFFKGREYSEFYDMKMEVRKGYPKPFSRYMLNCPKEKADQMDGRSFDVDTQLGSSLVEVEADGSSNRLLQDEKAIGQEKSTAGKQNKEGLAPLSVSSSVSLLFTTLLMCIFANRLATTEL